MRTIRQAVLAVFFLLVPTIAFGQDFSAGSAQERSPFTDMKFEGTVVHMRVAGEWYEWRALDGVPYERIRQKAIELDAKHWQKRLGEDLVAVLRALNAEPDASVALSLRPLDTDEVVVMRNVPMTRDKRKLLRDLNRMREEQAELERIDELIVHGIDTRAVFDEFLTVVGQLHAYADLKALDMEAVVAHEIEALGEDPSRAKIILAMQRVIARLGDGHARVMDWLAYAPPGRSNILLQHAKGGVVAFHRDRNDAQGAFLDADHPFVVGMDGVPIDEWIKAASIYEVDGSPALVRRRSTELLRYANLVRDQLDLPHAPEIAVTLRNADGSSTRDIQLPITDSRGIYGVWPRHATRVLDSGFGYIRLETMSLDADALAELERTLTSMADTPGLIIDVRDNGGGRRDAINTLVPYFLDPAQPAAARVVNVARGRLTVGNDPAYPDGYLADRHAYHAAWDGWSPAERAAIEHFQMSFKPQWEPPRGLFSDPHYMVVTREAGQPIYDRPVVVLMDEGCFSATDIFLGAMKGLPNVTLMGTPSSGGSARSGAHDIESLGITILLATMASYAPDGRLYDGNGITPDVLVHAIATDLIGTTDTQLYAAVVHLRSKK